MAEIFVPIAPFDGLYVMDAELPCAMLQITSINTNANKLQEAAEMKWFPGLNKQLQVGTHILKVGLDFDTLDLLIFNVNRGVSVFNTDRSAPPGTTQYAFLFTYPTDSLGVNLFVKSAYTERNLSYDLSKKEATQISINLTCEDPNVNIELFDWGTIEELVPLMGSQSPF